MENPNLSDLTNEELLEKKKQLDKSKIMHTIIIGFLGGIAIFGIVAWSLSANKHIGFLIPMLIPISIIYRMIKNSKNNRELEALLEERGLN